MYAIFEVVVARRRYLFKRPSRLFFYTRRHFHSEEEAWRWLKRRLPPFAWTAAYQACAGSCARACFAPTSNNERPPQ